MDWDDFAGKAQYGKLAAGGQWETAVRFLPGEFVTDAAAREYLGDRGEVACEAFFGSAFFGIRLQGSASQVARDLVLFARALHSAPSGAELFVALADALHVPVGRTFRYAELGAEGAWNSVGAFRIPGPAAAVTCFDEVWESVLASDVGRDASHPKAVEFTFDNGRGDGTSHWFAVPVSRGSVVDRAALQTALRRATGGLRISQA